MIDPALQARYDQWPEGPIGDLLRQRLVALDPERGFARVAFDAGPDFCNPMGVVQGGFQIAMLDEAMTDALLARTDWKFHPPTLELKASFFEPCRPGLAHAEGQVLKLGKSIAFLEGRLYEPGGALSAVATATAMLRPRTPA
jgi:uncharacterized protein (TIGR00369 family)